MKYIWLILFAGLFLFSACQESATKSNSASVKNSSSTAPGFEADEMSRKLVDSIIVAMGGQAAYDDIEYLRWNFFGNRRHTWNKKTGDLIIEGLRDKYTIRMNLNTMRGKVNYGGVEYAQPDTLQKYLTMGRDMWRNDAYWLVMPWKLKDPGVKLKYLGESPFRTFKAAHQIEMTYDNVGKTPNNKYILTIHPKKNWVIHWDFFENTNDQKPQLSTPWFNYKPFEGVLLSDYRGENFTITEIATGPSLAKYFE